MQTLIIAMMAIVLCVSMAGGNGCKNPEIFDVSASLLSMTFVVLDDAEVPSDGKVLVFSSPTIAGAMLARSDSFSIHCIPGGGTPVRENATDGTNTKNNSQPDTGVHGGLDVNGFTSGAGTLSITRTLEWIIPGNGFQSAKAQYDTNLSIAITWL
jgi:hypothetical protein